MNPYPTVGAGDPARQVRVLGQDRHASPAQQVNP